jgi:SAM-dependent methyltransferase
VTHSPQRPDIGFIPTPTDAVAAMLDLAELSPQDVVYDLGCGDGRLLIAAAQQSGCHGVGVDVNPDLLTTARHQAELAGVAQQLTFVQGNLFAAEIRPATVVLIYLLPHLNLRLRPRLLTELRPGTRIVSHQFDMDNWAPDLTLRLEPSEEDSVLYLWRVPQTIPEAWLSGDNS